MTAMVGIDQYGGRHFIAGKHPRKELLEKLGASHAEKIFEDKVVCDPGGREHSRRSVHTGYYIQGLWIILYTAWER